MLRACVLDFQGRWEDGLPWWNFATITVISPPLKMAAFEVLHGRKYRALLCASELEEALTTRPELIQGTKKLGKIQEYIKVAQSRHRSYVDRSLQF